MVVAVCDCGWSDLCMGPLGTGMDAAHAYAEHVGYVSPSDDIKPTCPPHGPDVKTDYLGYTYCGRCGRLTDDENAQ